MAATSALCAGESATVVSACEKSDEKRDNPNYDRSLSISTFKTMSEALLFCSRPRVRDTQQPGIASSVPFLGRSRPPISISSNPRSGGAFTRYLANEHVLVDDELADEPIIASDYNDNGTYEEAGYSHSAGSMTARACYKGALGLPAKPWLVSQESEIPVSFLREQDAARKHAAPPCVKSHQSIPLPYDRTHQLLPPPPPRVSLFSAAAPVPSRTTRKAQVLALQDIRVTISARQPRAVPVVVPDVPASSLRISLAACRALVDRRAGTRTRADVDSWRPHLIMREATTLAADEDDEAPPPPPPPSPPPPPPPPSPHLWPDLSPPSPPTTTPILSPSHVQRSSLATHAAATSPREPTVSARTFRAAMYEDAWSLAPPATPVLSAMQSASAHRGGAAPRTVPHPASLASALPEQSSKALLSMLRGGNAGWLAPVLRHVTEPSVAATPAPASPWPTIDDDEVAAGLAALDAPGHLSPSLLFCTRQ